MTLEAKAEQEDTTAAEAPEVTTAAEMETGETAAETAAVAEATVVVMLVTGTEMEATAVVTAEMMEEAMMAVARRRWGMAGA